MITTEKKLRVLAKLGAVLREHGILWAAGASLLLYFKGYTEDFHDLDILIGETDPAKMDEILKDFGPFPESEKGTYATKYFREFEVDGVEVDVIGGFAIVSQGQVYDCSLQASQITAYAEAYGEPIPLHSVSLWRDYYALIGRDAKVALIDQKSFVLGD